MSNLTIILTCVLMSFLTSALFMSAYKEEQKGDNAYIRTLLRSNQNLIAELIEKTDILRARVYDLEQKLKEMEKLDDGK